MKARTTNKNRPLAVALTYQADQMDAPEVGAVGERHLATLMKRVARRWGVTIVDEPELADELAELPVNSAIPPRLYQPVARVLAGAHRTKTGPRRRSFR